MGIDGEKESIESMLSAHLNDDVFDSFILFLIDWF